MDNASAQIEKLQQEVASLRDQLGRTEAKMLTCLVRAEAKSLATQTELAMLKDAIAKDTAKTRTDRAALDAVVKEEFSALWKNSRAIEQATAEIQLFIGPVVEKIFPKLLKTYVAVGERFKAAGTYSEFKRD